VSTRRKDLDSFKGSDDLIYLEEFCNG